MKRLACLITLAMFMASAPMFADVIFSDTTVDLSNYTATASFVNPEAVSITAANCSTCGSTGGEALQFVSTFGDTTTTEGLVDLGFVNNLFTYDPGTEGAISSITASVDKDLTITLTTTGSFGNTFRPVIEQDGVFYLAAIPGPGLSGGSTGFNVLSQSGLTAADFFAFDFADGEGNATGFVIPGSQHPNFSGDPMMFGLAQISGVDGFNGGVITTAYDNLSFDITPVPEPSSLLLLTGLVPLLAAMRRVHNRPRL